MSETDTPSNVHRTNRWIAWINLAESFAVLTIISLAFYILIPVHTPQTLRIPQGSVRAIITHLSQKGIELSVLDSYLMRYIGTPKSGLIFVGKGVKNRIDFLHTLTDPKSVIRKITLIPGETLTVFFDQLSKRYDFNATELQRAYNRYSPYPEAGIFADTYFVPETISEKALVKFLVSFSEKRYRNISEQAFGDYNTTGWQRILTVASVIQKEAANRKEMPLIASVIYNRLAKKMRLQMDGTLNYGKFSHIKVTPKRIREDNTTFNTYKHRGLPASPVCAVSFDAIDAALHPAKTDYLYFFKNARGTHDFAETFKQHRHNIRKKTKHERK